MSVEMFAYPANRRRLYIREELVAICLTAVNPHCAAAILSIFIRWTEYRLEAHQKAVNEARKLRQPEPTIDRWIFMTQEQLTREILFQYSQRTIQDALDWLRAEGYLLRRRNPNDGRDRTWQYRIHQARVQHMIDQYGASGLYFDPPVIRQKRQMQLANLPDATGKSASSSKQICQSITTKSSTKRITKSKAAAEEQPLQPPQAIEEKASPSEPVAEPELPPRPNIFTVYEQNIGALTGIAADELKDLVRDYTEYWVECAIKRAVLKNARNLKYMIACLKAWRVEGLPLEFAAAAQEQPAATPPQVQPDAPTETFVADSPAFKALMLAESAKLPALPPADFQPDLKDAQRRWKWMEARAQMARAAATAQLAQGASA